MELKLVTDLGSLDLAAAPGRDAHHHVGALDLPILHQRRLDLPIDLEIQPVGDGLVAQIILAVERQPQVRAGDDRVVMLDYNLTMRSDFSFS